MSHFLATAMPAPFVLTGLLLAATLMSLLGWLPRFETEETGGDAAARDGRRRERRLNRCAMNVL